MLPKPLDLPGPKLELFSLQNPSTHADDPPLSEAFVTDATPHGPPHHGEEFSNALVSNSDKPTTTAIVDDPHRVEDGNIELESFAAIQDDEVWPPIRSERVSISSRTIVVKRFAKSSFNGKSNLQKRIENILENNGLRVDTVSIVTMELFLNAEITFRDRRYAVKAMQNKCKIEKFFKQFRSKIGKAGRNICKMEILYAWDSDGLPKKYGEYWCSKSGTCFLPWHIFRNLDDDDRHHLEDGCIVDATTLPTPMSLKHFTLPYDQQVPGLEVAVEVEQSVPVPDTGDGNIDMQAIEDAPIKAPEQSQQIPELEVAVSDTGDGNLEMQAPSFPLTKATLASPPRSSRPVALKNKKVPKLPKKLGKLKCAICDQHISNKWNMKRHLKKHEKTGWFFKCDKCQFPFTTKDGFKRHKCAATDDASFTLTKYRR
ncbi:uncharacterized protein LOC116349728 [Contarinia nasturtii]|uniref:uncharacterized protein LOC116349728 n=1 Tax=Contarinia nasturtii TaxID=265458 RepID=UPI0012D3D789|nr:uncharacterized protein LOC116349728 [Contarinia nasturtii]XP_031637158.1 uncharacterized protein LOC116349728 [Contarinia nasturtii]